MPRIEDEDARLERLTLECEEAAKKMLDVAPLGEVAAAMASYAAALTVEAGVQFELLVAVMREQYDGRLREAVARREVVGKS